MCEKHTFEQLVCHHAHGAAHISIRHWHGEQSVDAAHTGEKMVLVSSCHAEQIVPCVCTIASSVCDNVIPNSHCHTPDNSFGSDSALKSTRHQMGSHRLLHPKHPVLQRVFLFVCYTLVIAQGVGRSFWKTPGRLTLLGFACSESSLSHPSSTGGCRGDGASGAMGTVISSPAASATAQWRKISKPESSNGGWEWDNRKRD